ncbi:MAG: hypothetical protein KDC98_25960 [Planctomycetes bacterium]|nr:hypothetical protein [Planctomycetota bacterium]
MHRQSINALFLLFGLFDLPAQEAFKANQFLPGDYHNLVHFDLARLRQSGVWDELGVGVSKMYLGMIENQVGLPFDDLDRVTMVPMARPRDADDDHGPSQVHVVVFEGNKALDVPRDVAISPFESETIGTCKVMRSQRWEDVLFYQPRPELQVRGATALLRPVLEGKPSLGMPCADILSLMSGRGDSLFHMVINLADDRLNDDALETLFPDTEWPEGGKPQYMLLRLAAVGDPDDPHVVFEAVLRHALAGDALAISEKGIDTLLAKGVEHPELRLIRPLLEKIERSRDRTDLTLKIDLGRPRAAVGTLMTVMVPLMMVGTTVQRQQVVEIAPAAEAKPEPADPKPVVTTPKPGEKRDPDKQLP